MGLVYEAKHLVLGTTVAIKVLRPELLEQNGRAALFLEEARCLAALSSDHVVRIHDAGRLETGLPYLVMERLSGMNLAELIQACGQLSAPVAVDYALQICAGLSEAHGIGLVHLDIKPTNLFLASRGGGPACLKILDFGIARWLDRPVTNDPLSIAGSPLGSPLYSSPEQLESRGDLDVRSDIWSLGVVLFEMLSGDCPFDQTSSGADRAEPVVPIPSVRQLRPGLDAGLARVVETCLERDRSRRYSTITELTTALLPFASGARSPAVSPAPPRSESRRPYARPTVHA